MSSENANSENAEEKYREIINLPRPEDPAVFRKHPRMPVSERAKIFSPFAALRGYDEHLEAENQRLQKDARPELSEEESARLSEQLSKLPKGAGVTVEYFQPEYPDAAYGICIKIQGTVTAVDPAARTLQINDTFIPFEELISLSLNN